MKKSKTNKLDLQRKTIRALAERPLLQVVGGIGTGRDTECCVSFTCDPTGSDHC